MVNFCEFDKYAAKSYCAIHGTSETLNLGDITKVDEREIEPFNMICGGSPCQDFSLAGKQAGAVWKCRSCGYEYNPLQVHYSKRDACGMCGSHDIDKTRSSLLVEWLRMIRGVKPVWGIYENVKNIVGKKKNSGIPHSGCLKKNCMNTDTTPIGVFLMQSIMEYHRTGNGYI